MRIGIVATAVGIASLLFLSRRAACDPPGFAFLEVPAGARAAALGGAYASLAQDADAAFWNPAGLSAVHGIQISGSHVEYVQKLRHDQFAVAGQGLGGGLAGSVRALYSEPIEARDEIGNLTGTWGSYDLEMGLAYGRRVGPDLSVGGTAQLVRERIADASASTYAFGAGAVWSPPSITGVRLGLSVHNLGPAARYDFDGGPGAPVGLPAAVQAGGSWQLVMAHGTALRAALEGRFTRGRSGIGMMGLEIGTLGGPKGAGAAFLRAGLRVNDETASLSFGAGYTLAGLRLDYAFVPFRLDLGDTHRISFIAQF